MNTLGLDGVVSSVCGLCKYGCGILVHLEKGKAIKVEGDPEKVADITWVSADMIRRAGSMQ